MFTSTMQDGPLTLGKLVRYASTVHGDARVTDWSPQRVRDLTFRELGRRAAQLANALRALGVQTGDRVATYAWNNSTHMVVYCAVPAMGAVLHTLNIRLSAQQNAYIADHAGDRVVIVDSSLLRQFAEFLPGVRSVEHVVVVGETSDATVDLPATVTVHRYDDLVGSADEQFEWPELDERSAAACCYTSGTTGNPKGVVYSHRSIWLHSLQVAASYTMGLAATDNALVIVPMFHAMAWGIPHAALMTGASLVMPDRYLQPEFVVRQLVESQPTLAAAVPTIWMGVITELDDATVAAMNLRMVMSGGSAVPPNLMREYSERFGIDIVQAWGMTETSPIGTFALAPPNTSDDEQWRYRSTQGRILPGVDFRLVSESGDPVPFDGVSVGELQAKGPWITGSYHGDPSTDKFDDGWLRTGDVGSVTSDGYLILRDRMKDVIKSGGEWISSVDLENAVMAHPGVAEAAAVAVPDDKWDERPLIAVVVEPGATASIEALRAHLAESFARWQVPEHWAFVEKIPKTSVGKFDKKRLREQIATGELTYVTHR